MGQSRGTASTPRQAPAAGDAPGSGTGLLRAVLPAQVPSTQEGLLQHTGQQ